MEISTGLDFRIPSKGQLKPSFIPEDDSPPIEEVVFDAPSSGVALAMYNLDDSIRDFAKASLNYGLARNYPVYLSTKNTILKVYDGRSRTSSKRSLTRSSPTNTELRA
jgi:isocitrate dehydrogenase